MHVLEDKVSIFAVFMFQVYFVEINSLLFVYFVYKITCQAHEVLKKCV